MTYQILAACTSSTLTLRSDREDLKSLSTSSVMYPGEGSRAVAQRDVLFARNDGLTIIRGGLEYVEKVNAEVQNAAGLLEMLE